jgi:hypothetical protein
MGHFFVLIATRGIKPFYGNISVMNRIVRGFIVLFLLVQAAAALAPQQGDANVTPSVPVAESVTVAYADQTTAPGPAISTETVLPAASRTIVIPPFVLVGIAVVIIAILGFAAQYLYFNYLNPPPPPE